MQPALPGRPLVHVCVAAAAVALAVGVAHGGAASAGFVTFDDGEYVYENPHVMGGLTQESLAWAFQIDERPHYFHPLTWLSLTFDAQLFGVDDHGVLNARPFHVVNVVLHALAAILLLEALRRATGRLGPSFVAVLLFALHPMTVEGVAWVTERKTVLSGVLGAGAILAYVWHAARPSRGRLLTVASLLCASLLAKPGLVSLPVLFLLLDVWPLRRLGIGGTATPSAFAPSTPRKLLVEKVPLFAIACAVLAIAMVSARTTTPPSHLLVPFGLRLENAVAVIPTYLRASFWPAGLAPFHPFPAGVDRSRIAAGLATVVLATAASIRSGRRYPMLPVGWGWFLVALAPSLGLVQSGLWPAWAERFAYLPVIGLAIAVSFFVADLASTRATRRVAFAAGLVVAAVLGVATRVQVRHWQDSEALYRRGVAIEPTSSVMRTNLGALLAQSGRLAEARTHLEVAVSSNPRSYIAHHVLATVFHRLGMLREAELHYGMALAIRPDDPGTLYDVAEFLRTVRGPQSARGYYMRFIRVAPPGFAALRARAERLISE